MNFSAVCPICSERIGFSSKPALGKKLTCNLCETPLVVTNLNPVTLDESFEDIEYGYYAHSTNNQNFVRCPLCDGKIDAGKKLKLHNQIICPECDAELEVCGIDPIELIWVYDEGLSIYEDEDVDTEQTIEADYADYSDDDDYGY